MPHVGHSYTCTRFYRKFKVKKQYSSGEDYICEFSKVNVRSFSPSLYSFPDGAVNYYYYFFFYTIQIIDSNNCLIGDGRVARWSHRDARIGLGTFPIPWFAGVLAAYILVVQTPSLGFWMEAGTGRKHGALRPHKPLRLIRDGEVGGMQGRVTLICLGTLHCTVRGMQGRVTLICFGTLHCTVRGMQGWVTLICLGTLHCAVRGMQG